MKKIISLILTAAMLLSITTFVAPVSAEQTREEFLNTPAMEYLDIPFTNDAFATVEEMFHYFPADNSYTKFPSKLPDGTPITNSWNVASYTSSSKTLGVNVFLIDTIIGNADGSYKGKFFTSDLTTVKETTYKFKANGISNFKLQSTETDGTMNFLYNHNGVSFKMGPIGGTGAHHTTTGALNAHKLPNTVSAYNAQGTIDSPTSVNILMNTWVVNGGGYAGLFPVKITYEDGTILTKYALSVDSNISRDDHVARTGGASNNEGDGDRLAKTIIYIPKTADISTGEKIKEASIIERNAEHETSASKKEAGYVYSYLSESNSEEIIGKKITLDDVKFPNDDLIIKGESVLFGDFNIARSPSAGGTNPRRYCPLGYADYINIPVNKKVTSVHMERDIAAALNWKDEMGNAVAVNDGNCAYIPVTIEGASDKYYYFAKLGRLTQNEQAVFAVTVAGESLQDKIDALEERIQALDATYNSAQKMEIAEIKNALEALKTEGVEDTDFEDALLTKLNDLYASAEEEIKAAQIASVEGKITNMAFKYVSSMRAEVEGIKAEYDALLSSGILSSEFNADLMAKFAKVYDVYVMSAGLEDKAEGWGNEYLYEMYNEVKDAKALADGLETNPSAGTGVVDKAVVDKIDKFASLADKGEKIDTAIDGLDIVYNKEQLETIVEIKKSIDEFKTAGGTDKGLANVELFNALYETAESDLLQRDIDLVVEKIQALPELYTATIDNEIAEIEKAITAVQNNGGVIPSQAIAKLESLIAQRDEEASYTTFDLPYNKDVVDSLGRYQDQFRGPDGNYVKDSNNHFKNQLPPEKQWTIVASLTGDMAAVEEDFVSRLGVDLETNKTTINGVPYQFGKIKTTVDGKIDKENNSVASVALVSSTVTVDVPNNAYSKLHAAMWADTEGAGLTVKYIYADGTSSEEENVKKIAGYREMSKLYSQNPTYYKVLNNDGKLSLRYYREYKPQYDSSPGGGYSIAIGDHILTPDDKKILDKIEFSFGTKDAHMFALTGQVANSVLLNKVLTESIENLENTAEVNVRAILEGCTNIMNSLDEKEVSYDASFAQIVEENKNIFVAIESVTAYTDLDNMTFTVKFTGPVAPSSITKALFAVTETIVEGTLVKEEAFTNYELIPVETDGEIREVRVVIKNDYDYDRKYNLTISREVAGVSGKTILTDTKKAYDSKPAVDAEITMENAAGTVKLTNNMAAPQEVTAIVAVYDANNSMVAKYLVNKTLASGETISQAVAFDLQDGQTIECLILDSLTNCRKVYNTYYFE